MFMSNVRRCIIISKRKWSRSYSYSQQQLYHRNSLESAFQELGVPMGATLSEVKSVYRRRALQCHPDLHPTDGEEFVRITAAYERIMKRGGPYRRHVASSPPHVSTERYHMPVAFWWVSLLLGSILFWYPSQMYLRNRSSMKEPSIGLRPTRDAVKRERIAAILLERQRTEKLQEPGFKR